MLITFKSEQSWAYRKCLYTWHVSPDHSYLAPYPSFLAEVPSVFNPLTKLGVPIRVLESCLWNRAAHLHGIAFIISFLHGSVGEESICKARDTGDVGLTPGFNPWSWKWQPTPSSILAQRIPWTEVPGGLQSTRLQELDTTEWVNVPS